MSKREIGDGGGKTGIVVITNIVIAVLCVVSIVTLYVGEFWNIGIVLTLDKEGIAAALEAAQSEETETSESEDVITTEELMSYIDDDFSAEFSIGLTLQGSQIVGAAFGAKEEAVKKLIGDEVDLLVENISGLVDDVIELAMRTIVNVVVDEAKSAVKAELSKEALSTDENSVMNQMRTQYDISEEDINNLIDDLDGTLNELLNGDVEQSVSTLEGSATLLKLTAVYAKQKLIEEGTPEEEIDQEMIEAKALTLKQEIVDGYRETLEDMTVNGKFSSQGVIVSMLSAMGLIKVGEDGEEIAEDKDGVRDYITDQIYSSIDEDTMSYIAMSLSVLGYFLLFVMACWAYVLLKIIIKLIASRNKTVGLFFPRFFGWMPHVFFVGMPMYAINHLPAILAASDMTAEELHTAQTIMNMFSINISSHTWFSALAAVILTVILVFYYPIRRSLKKEK